MIKLVVCKGTLKKDTKTRWGNVARRTNKKATRTCSRTTERKMHKDIMEGKDRKKKKKNQH